MKQTITCICCPIGCTLEITEQNQEYLVTGNKCARGKKYAIEEITAPKRVVTSTVKTSDAAHPMISVKTDHPIPKEKIFTIMELLRNIKVTPPIKVGDIIIENVADTGVNMIATKSIDK